MTYPLTFLSYPLSVLQLPTNSKQNCFNNFLFRHLLDYFPHQQLAIGMLVALNTVAAPCPPLLKEESGSLQFYLLLDVGIPAPRWGAGHVAYGRPTPRRRSWGAQVLLIEAQPVDGVRPVAAPGAPGPGLPGVGLLGNAAQSGW